MCLDLSMLSKVFVLLLALYLRHTESAVYDITTATTNWQSILSNLKAGDTAIIHQGTYTTAGSGFFQLTLNGTLTAPIIIQGAPNEPRPIIRNAQIGSGVQNILNVQGSYYMIKHIAFTGGSRGVRLGPKGIDLPSLWFPLANLFVCYLVSTHAVFDDIYIYDTTGTAFSANDAGLEYVNITLKNSEMKNTNAAGKAAQRLSALNLWLCTITSTCSSDHR